MKIFKLIAGILFIAGLTSCNNDQSLQKYYVENQEDKDFMALDIPASMFANIESLESEEKETMQSIKKINVLVLQKEDHPEKFEEEKLKLAEILKNEKYQLLMKYGGGNRKAELYFTGDDEAIDELIVYGYDDERGLGVGRLLGDNMNPSRIIELMKSMDKENINVEGFKDIEKIFGDMGVEKDSVSLN